MQLSGFDPEAFLQEYWQQKPLLIRNAWDAWQHPMAPEELAGLACEETIESRLIIGGTDTPSVEHGPIAAAQFDTLGGKDWTLLVQAVDHHVPAVASVLDAFRFIPNWRIDDVMVSFATEGGGVGAHFDQYDVFLIQGLGRRRWQLGDHCDGGSALLPHEDLRLLADFVPTEEWVLEPGDMLYVPPGIAHNGIAVSDQCMTYSIGFRAPSRADLVGGWRNEEVTEADESDRYTDPGLPTQGNPGEIAPDALAKLYAMVTENGGDETAFARWFGEFSSASKYPEIDWRPDTATAADDVAKALSKGAALIRNPASRFAFVEQGEGAVLLFIDGASYDCTGLVADFARALCARTDVALTEAMIVSEAVVERVATFINSGSLAFDS